MHSRKDRDMRIISGKYGKRRFDVPSNIKARPTTDFARENIFNVLSNTIDFEGTCLMSPALAGGFFTTGTAGKDQEIPK